MPDPVDFQGATPSGTPRRLVAGVVIVLFALGLAIAKPWSGDTAATPPPSAAALPTARQDTAPPPTSAPTASSGPTATPAPAFTDEFRLEPPPASSAAWTGIRWASIEWTSPVANLASVTRWAGGWMALGAAVDGWSRPLWASADGAVWTAVGEGGATTFWPYASVVAVAPLGSGLIALVRFPTGCGGATCQPTASGPTLLTAWRSSDGLTWEPAPGLPVDDGPSTSGAEIALAGNSHGVVLSVTPSTDGSELSPSAVYSSSDGTHWRRFEPGAIASGFRVASASATPSTLLLAGSVEASGRRRATIAWSTDLKAWHATPMPVLTGRPEPQNAWAVQQGARGILAMGSGIDGGGTELWWVSSDGQHWKPIPDYPPLGATPCDSTSSTCGLAARGSVVADGRRLVALGWGRPTRVWASSGDGQWRELRTEGVGPTIAPYQQVLLPGGVLAITVDGAWYGQAIVGGDQ